MAAPVLNPALVFIQEQIAKQTLLISINMLHTNQGIILESYTREGIYKKSLTIGQAKLNLVSLNNFLATLVNANDRIFGIDEATRKILHDGGGGILFSNESVLGEVQATTIETAYRNKTGAYEQTKFLTFLASSAIGNNSPVCVPVIPLGIPPNPTGYFVANSGWNLAGADEPCNAQPFIVIDVNNDMTYHSTYPLTSNFCDNQFLRNYIQGLTDGTRASGAVTLANYIALSDNLLPNTTGALMCPQTIAQICAVVASTAAGGNGKGVLMQLFGAADPISDASLIIEATIITEIKNGSYGFLLAFNPSTHSIVYELAPAIRDAYISSAVNTIHQLISSSKQVSDILYKSWCATDIHARIARDYMAEHSTGTAIYTDILVIKVFGKATNTDPLTMAATPIKDLGVYRYAKFCNTFRTGNNAAGLSTLELMTNQVCNIIGLTTRTNVGVFFVNSDITKPINSEIVVEMVIDYIKNQGKNKAIMVEKYKSLAIKLGFKIPNLDMKSLEEFLESAGILVSLSLLRSDPSTRDRVSGALNIIDPYLSPVPYYSYNYGIMSDLIQTVTVESEKSLYGRVEKFLRTNAALKVSKGKPSLNSVFTFHHVNSKGYELNPSSMGLYNLAHGGSITLKLKGTESVLEVFKKIPLIKKACRDALLRLLRHGNFYKAGGGKFTNVSADEIFQKMFISPAYVAQRNEAQAMVASSITGRKKTLEELWSLFYTMGITKSSGGVAKGDNLDITLNSAPTLVNSLAVKILPPQLQDTYENIKGSFKSYADVQDNATRALTDVINPGLGLMTTIQRKNIESLLNADSYAMLHSKPQVDDKVGPHQEADELNRSLAETNITVQINKAMCDMISSLTGAAAIGAAETVDQFVARAENTLSVAGAIPDSKKMAIRRIIDKFKTKAQAMNFDGMITGNQDTLREWTSGLKRSKKEQASIDKFTKVRDVHF